MPKVSIIVPVYNSQRYLVECLESLVNQSLKDIEIVIIDDGSKDNSAQIIEEYRSSYSNIIKVLSQKNSGQAVARNKGIQICTGEYIGFLDSDDTAELDMFEKMYATAKESDADFVYCDFYYVTDSGKQLNHLRKCEEPQKLILDCIVVPWNKLYKAEVIKNNNVYFPEGFFYEDTGWFVKTVPYIHKAIKLDEALVNHFKREDSSVTALDDKRVCHIFPVLEDTVRFYKTIGEYTKFEMELEYFFTKILLCSSLLRRVSRVRNKVVRKDLIHKTFAELNSYFPNYKENLYIKNKRSGLYMRVVNERNSVFFITIFKVLNRIRER